MSDMAPVFSALSSEISFSYVPGLHFKDYSGIFIGSLISPSKNTPLLCSDFSNFDIDTYRKIHASGEILVPYRFIDGCPFFLVIFVRFCLDQNFSARSPLQVKFDIESLKFQTDSANFDFLNNLVNISERFLNLYLDVFADLNIKWFDSARLDAISMIFANKIK